MDLDWVVWVLGFLVITIGAGIGVVIWEGLERLAEILRKGFSWHVLNVNAGRIKLRDAIDEGYKKIRLQTPMGAVYRSLKLEIDEDNITIYIDVYLRVGHSLQWQHYIHTTTKSVLMSELRKSSNSGAHYIVFSMFYYAAQLDELRYATPKKDE